MRTCVFPVLEHGEVGFRCGALQLFILEAMVGVFHCSCSCISIRLCEGLQRGSGGQLVAGGGGVAQRSGMLMT